MPKNPHRSAFSLFLLSLIAFCFPLQAQSIRGFITGSTDGLPLIGATVAMRSEAGKIVGVVTNTEGYYVLSRLAPDTYTFSVSFVGYKTHTETLRLKAGQVVTKSLILQEDEQSSEVVIEARDERGAADVTAGLQTVRAVDIDRIPVPDVSGDLAAYLTTMPGVVSDGDRGGQLFIRGGTASQNLIYIDNMLVYNPFHILGFYSAFPSDIVNKADVYAGGYGAKFGGRISSVLDIGTRNGNKRNFAGAVSVAPFVTSGRLEVPIIRDKVSLMASARQSVVDLVGPKLVGRPLPFQFGDQFAKLHATLSPSSQVSVSALRTNDRGTVASQDKLSNASLSDTTLTQAGWGNEAYGVRFLLLPTNFPVLADINLNTSIFHNEIGPRNKPTRKADVRQFGFSANLSYMIGESGLNYGIFLNNYSLGYTLGGQYQNFTSDAEYMTDVGGYVEADIVLFKKLKLTPGVRLHSFPRANRKYIEPRFKTVFTPNLKHKISAAWGIYHQEIVGLNDRRDAGDVFTAWTSSPFGKAVPEAMHAILGWQYKPSNKITCSVEGFYKTLENLAIGEWTPYPRFTTKLQPASGNVRGADFRIEADLGKFYGYISYGYASVLYEAKQASIPVWYGVDKLVFHPPHDRTHQTNAVLSYAVKGFAFNARWQFGTGLPFTQSIGFDDWFMLSGRLDITQEEGTIGRVLYGAPYQARMPDYHRLDVSVEKKIDFSKRLELLLQAGLINAYNQTNIFYLDLFTLERVDQLPLIPTFGMKITVK
ncbi:MAG: carboxypeptidase-like regulatory domain-containing protein [Bacteroidetes Order II. Incertae sedis bacterium]|nr:carboxypeptidase-like regulatory domain-containing protein [Bacteroidetes Order II. bacterium]